MPEKRQVNLFNNMICREREKQYRDAGIDNLSA